MMRFGFLRAVLLLGVVALPSGLLAQGSGTSYPLIWVTDKAVVDMRMDVDKETADKWTRNQTPVPDGSEPKAVVMDWREDRGDQTEYLYIPPAELADILRKEYIGDDAYFREEEGLDATPDDLTFEEDEGLDATPDDMTFEEDEGLDATPDDLGFDEEEVELADQRAREEDEAAKPKEVQEDDLEFEEEEGLRTRGANLQDGLWSSRANAPQIEGCGAQIANAALAASKAFSSKPVTFSKPWHPTDFGEGFNEGTWASTGPESFRGNMASHAAQGSPMKVRVTVDMKRRSAQHVDVLLHIHIQIPPEFSSLMGGTSECNVRVDGKYVRVGA